MITHFIDDCIPLGPWKQGNQMARKGKTNKRQKWLRNCDTVEI